MSKKRVHEIARELKAQGIELDNKDVVGELVALGYDVKSHSSSLEDDQANAAILKIVQQRKPKAPPAPVTAKGFVVRRKLPGLPIAAPAAETNHRDQQDAAQLEVAQHSGDARVRYHDRPVDHRCRVCLSTREFAVLPAWRTLSAGRQQAGEVGADHRGGDRGHHAHAEHGDAAG